MTSLNSWIGKIHDKHYRNSLVLSSEAACVSIHSIYPCHTMPLPLGMQNWLTELAKSFTEALHLFSKLWIASITCAFVTPLSLRSMRNTVSRPQSWEVFCALHSTSPEFTCKTAIAHTQSGEKVQLLLDMAQWCCLCSVHELTSKYVDKNWYWRAGTFTGGFWTMYLRSIEQQV